MGHKGQPCTGKTDHAQKSNSLCPFVVLYIELISSLGENYQICNDFLFSLSSQKLLLEYILIRLSQLSTP